MMDDRETPDADQMATEESIGTGLLNVARRDTETQHMNVDNDSSSRANAQTDVQMEIDIVVPSRKRKADGEVGGDVEIKRVRVGDLEPAGNDAKMEEQKRMARDHEMQGDETMGASLPLNRRNLMMLQLQYMDADERQAFGREEGWMTGPEQQERDEWRYRRRRRPSMVVLVAWRPAPPSL